MIRLSCSELCDASLRWIIDSVKEGRVCELRACAAMCELEASQAYGLQREFMSVRGLAWRGFGLTEGSAVLSAHG